jgi:uncharacterized protein YbcI
MEQKTKGQIESQISESIVKFEKEYMGRGPSETRAYIIKDMVFLRLKGVLTPAEEQLAKTPAGAEMIKKTRMQLMEHARPLLGNMISEITSCQIQSLHTDISTRTGERVIVFTLDRNLEDEFCA